MDKEEVDSWAFQDSPMDALLNPTHLDELGGATNLDSVRLKLRFD